MRIKRGFFHSYDNGQSSLIHFGQSILLNQNPTDSDTLHNDSLIDNEEIHFPARGSCTRVPLSLRERSPKRGKVRRKLEKKIGVESTKMEWYPVNFFIKKCPKDNLLSPLLKPPKYPLK